MTAHDRSRNSARPKHCFGRRPAYAPLRRSILESLRERLVVFTPTGCEVDTLMHSRTSGHCAARRATEVVHRVFRIIPDTLLGDRAPKSLRSLELRRGEGFVAFLMLNEAGMKSLLDGTFNAADPDLSLICGAERKAGWHLRLGQSMRAA